MKRLLSVLIGGRLGLLGWALAIVALIVGIWLGGYAAAVLVGASKATWLLWAVGVALKLRG